MPQTLMEARLSEQLPLHWQAPKIPTGASEALERKHKLPALVAGVLAARGWQPGDELAAFLSGRQTQAPDPLELLGVEAAGQRLWQAIDADEQITICGDYDADGVTGTALLVGALRAAGAKVDWFLPHRYHDGYGLNTGALDRLAAGHTKVIVTVDNGITSLTELAHARALGMDAIVTDHHLPGPELPAAHTIVNPRMMAAPGVFEPLAGVGVAYMLVCGMAALRPEARELAKVLEAQLDLVALGTIGDMAPLAGENRRLVRAGLARLATAPRLGLAELARSVKITLAGPGAGDAIAHAAGRMAHPDLALALLLADDMATAKTLADKLGNLNRQRRGLTEATEARCLELLGTGPLTDQPAILLAEAGWHHGVMGIVAARLAEKYRRPTILFAPDGGGWRGSGRSVPGFDLHAVLEELADYLGRYGGHAAAVGLTVPDERLGAFMADVQASIGRRRDARSSGPRDWRVDLEVSLADLTLRDVEGLSCLEPTGMANPAPVLAARDVQVVRQGTRGPAGQHLWLEVAQAGSTGKPLEAIGFNMGALYPLPDRTDIIFTPTADRWQGRQRLQLRLLAVGEPAGREEP
jgi:single-stranded-DNA-specific exonuclease